MPKPRREKPRMRVELRTPRGRVHRADQSLSDSLTELIVRSEETGDKHDLIKVVEGIAETGARVVMRLARSVMKSLGGAPRSG